MKLEAFQLVLLGDTEKPVRIAAKNLGALDDKDVAMINATTGRSHDLRREETVAISPSAPPVDLELAVGTSAFVENRKEKALPEQLALEPNYPNPFSEQTTLRYALPERTKIRLEIYDILGRRIRVLDRGRKEAGYHTVVWDGHNDLGHPVGSGVYFVRLKSSGKQKVQKVTVVR